MAQGFEWAEKSVRIDLWGWASAGDRRCQQCPRARFSQVHLNNLVKAGRRGSEHFSVLW
jgi:hypothetical protein